mgnify:CR=1 FL=1
MRLSDAPRRAFEGCWSFRGALPDLPFHLDEVGLVSGEQVSVINFLDMSVLSRKTGGRKKCGDDYAEYFSHFIPPLLLHNDFDFLTFGG